MRAKGNGDKDVCVQNLLAIVRGEVPYDRLRGLDARTVDKAASDAVTEAKQDAEWVLETYEPRATIQEIVASQVDAHTGNFTLKAVIT